MQQVAQGAAEVLRWSSGLRQLWHWPAPIALSHARAWWHDRGCMMSGLGLALNVAMNRAGPASGSGAIRS